jgi:hypothetical protein
MTNSVTDLTLDLLNVNVTDNDEICMICQDSLSCAVKYKLPECGHEYHTHCVVAWFRNGDSRCPYCGNKGVNNNNENKKISSSRYKYNNYTYKDCKLAELKKYSKKSGANPLLAKRFNELDILNKALTEKLENQKKFKIKLNTELTNYKDAEKERRVLRSKIFTSRVSIHNKKDSIIDMHIIPLIIPIPVDVNF